LGRLRGLEEDWTLSLARKGLGAPGGAGGGHLGTQGGQRRLQDSLPGRWGSAQEGFRLSRQDGSRADAREGPSAACSLPPGAGPRSPEVRTPSSGTAAAQPCCGLGLTLVGAVGVSLVAVVPAVIVPVAGPVHRDAAPAVALELVAGAGVAAARLVAVVPTVVVWRAKGSGKGLRRAPSQPARRADGGMARGRKAKTSHQRRWAGEAGNSGDQMDHAGTQDSGHRQPPALVAGPLREGLRGTQSPQLPALPPPTRSATAPAAHKENETQKLHRSAMYLGRPGGSPAPRGPLCSGAERSWGDGALLYGVHPRGDGLLWPITGRQLAWRRPHRPLTGRGSFSLTVLRHWQCSPSARPAGTGTGLAWLAGTATGLCSTADAVLELGKGPLSPRASPAAQGSSPWAPRQRH